MRVYELHFNPKIKEDFIQDTFCYEPTNIYERKLGSLYMAGQLKNTLPKNLKFLDNLAEVIKKNYYSQFRSNTEGALKGTLKLTNEYLEKIVKAGDVSWLGNLNFLILTLSFQKNWWELNLTKTGKFKVLLLREGEITDIGKNLELQGIDPYPLKIFINIVSGKLSFTDKLLILSNEVYDFFSASGILEKLAGSHDFNEKTLRVILKTKENELSQISGVCLICDLTSAINEDHYPPFIPSKKSSEKKPIVFQKELEKFSWLEVFKPPIRFLLKIFKIIGGSFKKIPNIFKFKKQEIPEDTEEIISSPEEISPPPQKKILFSLNSLKEKIVSPFKKLVSFPKKIKNILIPQAIYRIKLFIKHRNTILVSTFIALLLLGSFVFQREKISQLKEIETTLNKIEGKLTTAEGYLMLKDIKLETLEKANLLLKEARDDVLPLTKIEGALQEKAVSLKNSIEENLFTINKLEKIPDPELVFEFTAEDFLPQKMVNLKGNLYFFSPFSQNIVKVNPSLNNQNFDSLNKGDFVNFAIATEDSILFFSKPDKITLLNNDTFKVEAPYPDFNFDDINYYKGNVYFLDSGKNEIIKYPAPIETGKDSPILWLNPQTKKIKDSISFAMDGGIWLLEKENKISRYSLGKYEKTLDLDIFPSLKNVSQIFTSPALPYLYLLEPVQSRIIIINKSGGVIKQFQSEKFDNLKDFTVSSNGKTIWLLNGTKVYRISF